MKIHLSPQLSLAFLPLPLAPVTVAWVCLLGSNACAQGQHQHPVSKGNQNKEPLWHQHGSLDGLGAHLEHCSILLWGKGVPPQASLQTRAPAQREVAAHQYAGVVAARQ